MKDSNKIISLTVKSNLLQSTKEVANLNTKLEATKKLLGEINKKYDNLSKTDLKILTKSLESSEAAAKNLIKVLKEGNNELEKMNVFSNKKGKNPILVGSISDTVGNISLKGAAATSFATFAITEAKKLMEYEKEIQKFSSSLQNVNNDVVKNAAVSVKSLSDVYADLDADALVKTSTTLSKTMSISLDESFSLLEKGISTTASDRNEYLDWITEYSSVLKDSEYSATDIFNIQQVAEKLGIFKDKLLDTLKEFKIRISDLSKGQKDTLTDAFGKDFTKKLTKDINSGAISAKEGLATIVKALETTSITAQQKQAVISNIFGAAGEDLGAQFLPAMKEVTQNVGQLGKAFDSLSSGQKANLQATKEMNTAWGWVKDNILPNANTVEHLTAAFKRLTPIIVGVGLAIATLASGGAVLAIASITAGVLGLAKAWETASENTYEAIAAKKAYGAAQTTTSFNTTIQTRGDELKNVKDALETLRNSSNKNADLTKAESIMSKYAEKFGTSLEKILTSLGVSTLEDAVKGGENAINQLSNSLLGLDEKILNSSNVMGILPSEVQQFVNVTMSSTDAISNLEAEINKNNKIISGIYTLQGNDLGIADREKIDNLTKSNDKLRESIDRIKKTESIISDTKLYQGKVLEKTKNVEEKGGTKKDVRYTSDIPGLEMRVRDLQDKLADLSTSVGAASTEYKKIARDLDSASKILINAYENYNKKAKSNDIIDNSAERERLKKELAAFAEQRNKLELQRRIAEDPAYNTRGAYTRVNVPKGMKTAYKPYIGADGFLDANKLFGTTGTEIDYATIRVSIASEMERLQKMEEELNAQLKAHEESLKVQTKEGYIEISIKKKELEERKKSIESQARKREIDLLRIEAETALKVQMDRLTEEERKGLLSYKEFTDKAIIEKEQEKRKFYEQSQVQLQTILGEDLSKYTSMHEEGVFKGTYFLENIDFSQIDDTQKEGVRNIIDGMRNNIADIESKFFDAVEEQARNNEYIQNILTRVKNENKLEIDANALLMETLQNDIDTYNLLFSKALQFYNEELTKTPFDVLTTEEKDNIKNLHDNLQRTRKEIYEKQLQQLELELGDGLRMLVERGFDVNSLEYKNLILEYQNKRQGIDTSYLNDARSINDNAKMKNNKPSRELEQWQTDLSSYMNGIQPIIDNSMSLINSLFDYYSQILQNQLEGINKAINSTETQIQDSMGNIDRMSADLEGKESGRRDALLRGIEEERNRQEELTRYKLKLQEDAVKKEKELAKQRQRQSLLQAIISTALGVTTALGSSVPPLNFINAGLVGAAGGVQIATIAAQKFAKGGYTGDGFGNKVDETGYRVAGIVHEGEYVIPKSMVNANKEMVNNIEQMRIGGSVVKNTENGIERELIEMKKELFAVLQKPIYTNAVESSRVSNGRKNKMVSF